MEELNEEINKNKFKKIFIFGGVFVVLVVICGLFFLNTGFKNDDPSAQVSRSVEELMRDIEAKDKQILLLTKENDTLKQKTKMPQSQMAQNSKEIISKLNFLPKAYSKVVFDCSDFRVGKWESPRDCSKMLKNKINNLQKDGLIAFESIGVVDNTKYRGLSPELKQEGLASFRAQSAIGIIDNTFSQSNVFRGKTIQEGKKRGYIVRAYYLHRADGSTNATSTPVVGKTDKNNNATAPKQTKKSTKKDQKSPSKTKQSSQKQKPYQGQKKPQKSTKNTSPKVEQKKALNTSDAPKIKEVEETKGSVNEVEIDSPIPLPETTEAQNNPTPEIVAPEQNQTDEKTQQPQDQPNQQKEDIEQPQAEQK